MRGGVGEGGGRRVERKEGSEGRWAGRKTGRRRYTR